MITAKLVRGKGTRVKMESPGVFSFPTSNYLLYKEEENITEKNSVDLELSLNVKLMFI